MEYPKIKVPETHVYKLHILNASNEVSHILVFNRDQPYENEEPLYEHITNLADDAQLIYSKQQLLADDSIRILKKKILMDIATNTDLRVSYEELYLYGYLENTQSLPALFDELLAIQQQQDPTVIDHNTLLHTTMIRVFGDVPFPTTTDIRTNYNLDEFITLIQQSPKTLYRCTPIGPKSSTHEFQADPYSTGITPVFVEYLENALLMNVGQPRDNTLYLCMAEPVLAFHNASKTGVSQAALVDMYFKLLHPFHVRGLADLTRMRPVLNKKTKELMDPNVFALYDSVQLFHDVYYSRKGETAYTQRGIQSFQIQLHPDFRNALPLEVIFKSIHATKLVPFIKYNPGERRENIYRMYFEKVSKNGKKVPYLKDKLILKLSREMGRSGQISLYIQQPFVETAAALYLHFELSGRVTIQCELKRPLAETEIDVLLTDAINPVIRSINTFLEQTGFRIPEYTSMRGTNVNVDKVRYILKTPVTNRVVLRNVGCIYSIFNVFRDNAEAGTAEMRFKRVDNYQEMDAKTIFISEMRDDIPAAIEGLMLNFSMTPDDAKLEIARFFDAHADALGNVVNNPGFPVTMRLDKTIEATYLTFEITQINNLNYLDVLFVYLDSLIRITQNLRSSAFSRDTIGRVCKQAQSQKTQDVSHVKNVVVSTSTGVGAIAPIPAPKKVIADFDLLKELEIDVDETGLQMPDTVDLPEEEGAQPASEVLDGVFFDDDDDFDGDMVSETEIQAMMENADKYNASSGVTSILPKSLFPQNPEMGKTPKSDGSSPEGVFFDEEETEIENGEMENTNAKTVAEKETVGQTSNSPKSLLPPPPIQKTENAEMPMAEKTPKSDGSSPQGVFFDDDEEENENEKETENENGEIENTNAKTVAEKETVGQTSILPKSILETLGFGENPEKEETAKTPKSDGSSPEGVFFDEDDLDMEDMEGGDESDNAEDMFDDDMGENVLKNDTPSGVSLNNPNPFLKRLTSREPELYLTSKQGKYKSYSSNCQPVNRQPVILTDAEKRKIDTEHPGSYHHAIKYGTDPKNKFWYVCPRYWCFLTNTSMTKEEVDSGKCGAIIPDKATTIPKGAYVYEFKTEDHFDEKGNYVEHYPGFALKEDMHPKGYCLPCCFKNWNKGKQKERKEQCLGMTVDDPDGSYDVDETPTASMATATATRHATATAPIPKRQNMYIISFDTYPIPESRWGFLPISAQMYVGTNYAQAVDKNNNALIQPNKTVMLRYGVEQVKGQSFLGVFADAYTHIQGGVTPRVAEFKQTLSTLVTLDLFLKLHNGSLVSSFRRSAPNRNLDVYKYRDTPFFQKHPPTTDENKQILLSTLGAYETFLEYLKDDTQPIDHTYLWDLFCIVTKLNLILLEVRNNDVTDKIELVCPTNVYSNMMYNPRKDSMIVIKHDEFYEPVYQYRVTDGVVEPQKTISEKTLNPTLKQLLLNIKYTSNKYCSPLPSVPKVYKFRPPILLDELLQHITAVSCTPVSQVVNYQGQVIGVVAGVPDAWAEELGIPLRAPQPVPTVPVPTTATVPVPTAAVAELPKSPDAQPAVTPVEHPAVVGVETAPITWLQFHSKSALLKNHVLPPNALRNLSNFSAHDVEYEGVLYPTIEHAFQAQKYTCTQQPELAEQLFSSATTAFTTPVEAKTAGGKTAMKVRGLALDVKCWDAKKQAVMETLVESKLQRHADIRDILKLAKQNNIRFIHFSRMDMEWGGHVDENGMLSKGKNKLGVIYNHYIEQYYSHPASTQRVAGGAGEGDAAVVMVRNTIMLPCFPSVPRNDMPVVEMDEVSNWNPYEYTRNLLMHISKQSQLKIPCRPMMKVVDEGLIVGVITETYQFVQLNPPKENVVMDNLHTLNNANFNVVDRVLATQRRPDMERVVVMKNIKLETAFYASFRSTVRKLMTVNVKVRTQMLTAIENKTTLYRQKVEAVVDLLKLLGRGRIRFEDIDREVLMELNDVEDCNPASGNTAYCVVRDDGTPQLILPKTHLLSGKNNEMVYYTRLADELVRYDRVKMFMFQPQMFLNLNQTDYQVSADEFMLIQSALTSEYFDDMDVLNENTHIQNVAYQFAHPANTQTYSNQLIALADQQFVDVSAPTEGAEALCIKSASIPIVGNSMSMWVRSFPRQAREIVFQNTPTCSFHVMLTILNDKFGKMVDVRAVKELLWNGYSKLMDPYEPKLVEILRNQGKLRLMSPVVGGRVTLDALLFSENYYLSDLDIWVLATTYNLPVVLFSSTYLKGVQGKINWLKLGGGVGDKYYFVRSTITAERDNVSEYHLVKPAMQLNELGEFTAQYQSAIQGSHEHAKHVRSLVQMLESVEFIKPKGRGK